MEEYAATFDDDDIKFVGDVERGDRPVHAERRRPESRSAAAARNNIGDVWVVAEVLGDAAGGKPAPTLRARAHLLVTVPLYMRFDPTRDTMSQSRPRASFIRSRRPAGGSSTWCRARRCSRSTTARRPILDALSPAARGRSTS